MVLPYLGCVPLFEDFFSWVVYLLGGCDVVCGAGWKECGRKFYRVCICGRLLVWQTFRIVVTRESLFPYYIGSEGDSRYIHVVE